MDNENTTPAEDHAPSEIRAERSIVDLLTEASDRLSVIEAHKAAGNFVRAAIQLLQSSTIESGESRGIVH